jgi:hypothetical protein
LPLTSSLGYYDVKKNLMACTNYLSMIGKQWICFDLAYSLNRGDRWMQDSGKEIQGQHQIARPRTTCGCKIKMLLTKLGFEDDISIKFV